MELKGTIKAIKETKEYGAKNFRKRELVLTTDDKYPQHLLIEFIKDKCDELDTFKVGDEVTIFINLQGREWINKAGEEVYFNSIQGWRIVKESVEQPKDVKLFVDKSLASSEEVEQEDDDLPF